MISHAGDADVEACRDLLRVHDGDYAAATLLDDLLVVRYLGQSTERARKLFTAVAQTAADHDRSQRQPAAYLGYLIHPRTTSRSRWN